MSQSEILQCDNHQHPSKVAIIGCGFTGTSAFYQMVTSYPVKHITIFESSGEFGPGYPYQTNERKEYLINSTNDTMSVTSSDPKGFYRWLCSQEKYGPETDPKGHMPRAVFGEFLKDVFQSVRTLAAIKGIEVELIPAEATGISEDADGKSTISWPGGQICADCVILTSGKCPTDIPNSLTSPSAENNFFKDHVSCGELDDIPLDADIHVLGASLSAYDVINWAFSLDTGCNFERGPTGELKFNSGPNKRKVVLMSRSGRLKNAAPLKSPEIVRDNFTLDKLLTAVAVDEGGITLPQIVEAIRSDALENEYRIDLEALTNPYANCKTFSEVQKRAEALLEESIAQAKNGTNVLFSIILDAEREIYQAFLENRLTREAESDYRSLYESQFLSIIAPCPISTAEKILALLRAGRVEIVSGVASARYDDQSHNFEIKYKCGVIKAKYLINASGRCDKRVSSSSQPRLIQSLVAQGLMKSHHRDGLELPGADIDPESYRLPDSQNIYLANMFLWGPTFFTSGATLMALAVEKILANAFGYPVFGSGSGDSDLNC